MTSSRCRGVSLNRSKGARCLPRLFFLSFFLFFFCFFRQTDPFWKQRKARMGKKNLYLSEPAFLSYRNGINNETWKLVRKEREKKNIFLTRVLLYLGLVFNFIVVQNWPISNFFFTSEHIFLWQIWGRLTVFLFFFFSF